MFSPRLSFWTLLCLLSLPFTHARVANQLAARLGLIKRDVCSEDGVYSLVSSRDDNTVFCSRWNTSPNATTTTYYTAFTLVLCVLTRIASLTEPSTSVDVLTTTTVTAPLISRATTTTTVTATSNIFVPKLKRAPLPTERALLRRMTDLDQIAAIADAFMDDPTSSTSSNVQTVFYTSISSACSCLNYGPLFTDTVSETDATIVSLNSSVVLPLLISYRPGHTPRTPLPPSLPQLPRS